jgi:hypothetical protein
VRGVKLSGVVAKIIGSWPGVSALVLAMGLAAPSHAFAACTGTLNGHYGVHVNGSTTQGVSKFITGVLSFNTACVVSGDISFGENNAVSPFVPLYAGSYVTNSDGSIMLSLTLQQGATPEVYAIGYSSAFDEAVGAEMDNSAVATIDLRAQTPPGGAVMSSYSNATVQGAFVSSCSGISGTYTDLNNFTFDGTNSSGVGNITNGVDDYNNYGQSGVEPYIGQYAVNSDGTWTGYVVVGGVQYGITGVIDNGGNEVQFVYSANHADITACIAKRAVVAQPQVAAAKWFSCHVDYGVTSQAANTFKAAIIVSNTGNTALPNWSLSWSYANGQTITSAVNAKVSQKAGVVTMVGTSDNANLPAGGSATQVTFVGKGSKATNTAPTSFSVNGVACN